MSTRKKYIDLARDWNPILGPRHVKDGRFSGEEFRQKILRPSFNGYDEIVVDLDTFTETSPAFFAEAFGGLVVEFSYQAVKDKIRFHAVRRAYLIPRIDRWMQTAEQMVPGTAPSIENTHERINE